MKGRYKLYSVKTMLKCIVRPKDISFRLTHYALTFIFNRSPKPILFIVQRVLKTDKTEKVKVVFYSNGTLKAISNHFFYKISLFQSAMKIDLINRDVIFSGLQDIITPIKVIGRRPLIVKMELLGKIESKEEAVKAAFYLLSRMMEDSKVSTLEDMTYLEDIQEGLKIIQKHFGEDIKNIFLLRINAVLAHGVRLGKTHGDFHSGNLLKDSNSCYSMIDFDRSSAIGIQSTDVLHFILWYELKQDGYKITWYEKLIELCKSNYHHGGYNLLKHYIDIDMRDGFLLLFLTRLTKDIQSEVEFELQEHWIKKVVDYYRNWYSKLDKAEI